MSQVRYVIDGYGQVELNNCAFRRDGRIEAQLPLDATDFATAYAENGMVLVVDRPKKVIRFIDSSEKMPLGLNYTTEHIYDERTPGLKNFKLKRGDVQLPRIGLLAIGDVFTTNCISRDSTEFASDAALVTALGAIATTPLYGIPQGDGSIGITATAPQSGACLTIDKKTTMPDGTLGVQFTVIAL